MPTLWDAARQAGMTTASIQWPVSVGARVTWNIPEIWRANAPDDAKLIRAVSTPGLLAELEPQLGSYPRALDIEADERRGRYAVRILEAKRPTLLTLHLIALDHTQHETGPGTREAIAVLERLDAIIGALRDTAERVAPGRAVLAIVSDHGFARTDAQLNLFPAFRDAGLFSDDGTGRISDWKAMPWTAGGSVAIVLKGTIRRGDARRGAQSAWRARHRARERHRPRPRGRRAAPARRLSHGVVPGRAQAGMADGLEPYRSLSGPRTSRTARTATCPIYPKPPCLVLRHWPRCAGRALARHHRHAPHRADPRAPPGLASPTAEGKILLP